MRDTTHWIASDSILFVVSTKEKTFVPRYNDRFYAVKWIYMIRLHEWSRWKISTRKTNNIDIWFGHILEEQIIGCCIMALYLVEPLLSARLRPEGLFQMSIDRYAIKNIRQRERKGNQDRLIKTIDTNDYQSLVCHKILQG